MTQCVVGTQPTTTQSSPSGLKSGGKNTWVDVNDTTWTALPPSPLSGRNSMMLQNNSNVDIWLNFDNTVVGFTGSALLRSGSDFPLDITDTIFYYAKSSVGTVTVYVQEIA